MHIEGTAILILNFVAIGLLPFVFFKRDGKFNPMWWATALPFYVSSGSLFFLPPVFHGGEETRAVVAMLLSFASITFIGFTLGTHRIPIALWHQSNDAPKHIVTWGAYAHVRHPFYASFLIALTAAAIYCPQPLTIGALLYGMVILNVTAAREERKLAESEFGSEYREYMRHTGRFIPRPRIL